MELDFRKNLGLFDRAFRFLLAVFLVIAVLDGGITGVWAVFSIAFAIFQFIEAAFAY